MHICFTYSNFHIRIMVLFARLQVSGPVNVHVRRGCLDTGQQPVHAASIARADRARGVELAVVLVDRHTNRKRGPAAVQRLAPEVRQPVR